MVGPRAMRLCARLAPGRGSVVPVASTIAGPVSAFSTSTSTAFSTSTCTASTTAGTNHCSNHRFSHRLSHRPSHRPSVTSGASSSLALASRERTASFRTWTVLMAGKESDLGKESRAEEADAQKKQQLQKQKEGKGHWHEGLATDSESMIKADRGEADAGPESIQKMQKETADQANKARGK